jgi:hypothetical protein
VGQGRGVQGRARRRARQAAAAAGNAPHRRANEQSGAPARRCPNAHRAVEQYPWLTPERAASLAPGCAALAVAAVWADGHASGAAPGAPLGPASAPGKLGNACSGGGDGPSLLVSDCDLLDGLALQLLRENGA